jgi:hypothetical protein
MSIDYLEFFQGQCFGALACSDDAYGEDQIVEDIDEEIFEEMMGNDEFGFTVLNPIEAWEHQSKGSRLIQLMKKLKHLHKQGRSLQGYCRQNRPNRSRTRTYRSRRSSAFNPSFRQRRGYPVHPSFRQRRGHPMANPMMGHRGMFFGAEHIDEQLAETDMLLNQPHHQPHHVGPHPHDPNLVGPPIGPDGQPLHPHDPNLVGPPIGPDGQPLDEFGNVAAPMHLAMDNVARFHSGKHQKPQNYGHAKRMLSKITSEMRKVRSDITAVWRKASGGFKSRWSKRGEHKKLIVRETKNPAVFIKKYGPHTLQC